MYFEQEIYIKPEHKLSTKALIKVACIDLKSGKSCLPEMLLKQLPSLE